MALIDLSNLTTTPLPNPIPPETITQAQTQLQLIADWVEKQFFSLTALWQVLIVLGAFLLGYLISRYPASQLVKLASNLGNPSFLFRIYSSLAKVMWPIISVTFLWIAIAVFDHFQLPNGGLRVVASLLNAWIIVRIATANMEEGFWQSLIAITAWTIAALYILRLIGPVSSALDNAAYKFGDIRISLLSVLTSIFIACVALWLGRIVGDAAQSQLKGSKTLTPSMAGLLGQVIKVALMGMAIVIALNAAGINLTALAVFSGALGVGIGFGLQAVFSNFVSGVIILFEKSIKVGDFIELSSGVTGQVKEINIRSTLVTTNDNVDILVPNEEFIKAQVINWTLKETARRIRVKFGVAYGSDKEIVKKAALEAAANVEWTFDDGASRKPQVWLTGFGDSALDFELVVWLQDNAVHRPAKVQADYYWHLHTALEKYKLEIPFPQRDVNFRNSAPVRVQIEPSSEAGEV